MKRASFLIKPASSSCNMKCQYCFYEDVSEHRKVKNYGIMQKDTMHKIIDNVFSDIELHEVHFAFQGGEPTLAGLDYFQAFTSYCEKKQRDIQVTYSIQSNGYCLTEDWMSLFKRYHFLVGVSLDGYKENHNLFRLTHKNQDSFDDVMHTIHMLKQYHIQYNILTVLTKELAMHPKKVYEFYQEQDFKYVQFISCLSSLENKHDDFSLTPQFFFSFYNELYKIWSNDIKQGKYISISLFDNILEILLKQYPSQCGFVGQCHIQYIIESQGDVYPCDFYVLDEYKLGNATQNSFLNMSNHKNAQKFLKKDSLPQVCQNCQYLKICYGQCQRQRGAIIDHHYCGYQRLLDYILKDIVNLLPYMKVAYHNDV